MEILYIQTNRAKQAGGSKIITIVAQNFMQMTFKSLLYLTAATDTAEYP